MFMPFVFRMITFFLYRTDVKMNVSNHAFITK